MNAGAMSFPRLREYNLGAEGQRGIFISGRGTLVIATLPVAPTLVTQRQVISRRVKNVANKCSFLKTK